LSKLIRLGKTRIDATRPIKIICDTKEAAMRMFTDYGKAKRSGTSFPEGFRPETKLTWNGNLYVLVMKNWITVPKTVKLD